MSRIEGQLSGNVLKKKKLSSPLLLLPLPPGWERGQLKWHWSDILDPQVDRVSMMAMPTFLPQYPVTSWSGSASALYRLPAHLCTVT